MVLKEVNILITGIQHRQRASGDNLFCFCFHDCKMNAQGIVSIILHIT